MQELQCVLYISEATRDFSEEELEALSVRSYYNNLTQGMTGFLYYENGHFLQYLEGEGHGLAPLMERISKDHRHRVIYKIEEIVEERRFGNWTMKSGFENIMDDSVMEQTIIQTMTIFANNRITMPQTTKKELFRFIDDLSISS